MTSHILAALQPVLGTPVLKKSYFSRLRPVYKVSVNAPPPPSDVHNRIIGYGTVAFAFAAFVVSCLAYIDLEEQVKEARVQSKAAQDQATTAMKGQRPWLFGAELKVSEKVRKPVRGENFGWFIPVTITLRNTGNEPALSARSLIKATMMEFMGSILAPQKEACFSPDIDAGGDVIFPGQERPDENLVQVDQKMLDDIANDPEVGRALVIVGCIKYRSPDDVEHSTGVAYHMSVQIDGRSRTSRLPRDLSSVDPKAFRAVAIRESGAAWAN